MSEISIGDAALAGPRAAAAQPAILIIWYVIMALISFAIVYVIADLLGPVMADLRSLQAAGPPKDPAVAMQAMSAIGAKAIPANFFLALLSLIIGAVTNGAANRLILRPDDRGLGYFKLGADELRLIVVMLVIALIFVAVTFVGMLIGGLLAATGGGAQNPGKMQAGVLAGFVFAIPVLLFLAVRLSLAPAQTVATRSINIFGSWTLTRGRFWPILGTYLISFVGYVVVAIVAAVLTNVLARSVGVTAGGVGMPPSAIPQAGLAAAPVIIYVLVNAMTQVASLVLLACPGAALYRQVTNQADTF